MLQLQQQNQEILKSTPSALRDSSVDDETPSEKLIENQNDEEVIPEGEGVNRIWNPDSVSRIINEQNSDSEDSESWCQFFHEYSATIWQDIKFLFSIVPVAGCVSLVHPASMWTRKDLVEFKSQVRKEGADTVMKVGHGETVTVRKPRHVLGLIIQLDLVTYF